MNKQLTVILAVCMVAWLTALTWITLGGEKVEISESLQNGESATVAYVHGDSVQARYAFIADQERQMFLAVQQSQLALERIVRPLQEEAQELIDYANGPSATQEEQQIAQGRLYEIEAQLAQIQSESQNQLIQLENQLQGEVARRLSSEVAEFAQQNGLEVVLNWGLSGEGVLYGSPAFDVTEALLTFMNNRYEPAEVNESESE